MDANLSVRVQRQCRARRNRAAHAPGLQPVRIQAHAASALEQVEHHTTLLDRHNPDKTAARFRITHART